MPVHVFYDNSNILWGARNACIDLEPEVYEFAVRIHFKNIFQLIDDGREVATKVLAGSVPPSCEPLWAYAHQNGYTTDLLRKVEREDGSVGEQGVDELRRATLHLKIANTLLDHSHGTLAIATGDGRVSEFGTGFRTQIDRALRHGWEIEVWTWAQACHRIYREYDADQTKRFTLRELNFHYYNITFLRQGEYYRELPDGVRQRIIVPNRTVRPR